MYPLIPCRNCSAWAGWCGICAATWVNVMTGRSGFVVSAHRFEGSAEVVEFDFSCEDLGTADLRWCGLAHLALRCDLKRGTEHYHVT